MLRKIALAAVAVAATGSAAVAADLYIPQTPAPIVESAGVGFEGLYTGVQLGGYFEDGADTQVLIGGVIGYNFATDPLLLGVELQGNYYFENDDYFAAGEILALGKIGFVADSLAVYATGGVGYIWEENDDYGVYALGLGAEFLVSDDMSIRGDVLAMGFDDGFEGARATVGVLWHF
jgi:outer membrane immunogenic protein